MAGLLLLTILIFDCESRVTGFRDEGGRIAIADNNRVDLTNPTRSFNCLKGYNFECELEDIQAHLA